MSFPPSGLSDFVVVNRSVVLAMNVITVIAQPSADRVVLLVSTSTGSPAFVSGRANMAASTGISVPIGFSPLRLQWTLDGALVNQAWYALVPGPSTIEICEVFYRPNR